MQLPAPFTSLRWEEVNRGQKHKPQTKGRQIALPPFEMICR